MFLPSSLICYDADETHQALSGLEQILDASCVRHVNVLFKRNPLVTQTEETVDPMYYVNCLKFVFKQD